MESKILRLFLFCTLGACICYYPNGDVSPQDVPCTSNSNSTCCGIGYACLTNQICMDTSLTPASSGSTKYVRGSCTDKSFSSSACPLFCDNAKYDDVGGGEGMEKCTNVQGDAYRCIDFNPNSQCNSSLYVLQFPGTPSVITTIGMTTTSMATTSSSNLSSPTSNPSSLTSTPSSTTPIAEAPSNGSSTTVQPRKFNKAKVGIGVGVGVGVLVLLSIVGGFYIWHRHRRPGRSHDTGSRAAPHSHANTSHQDVFEMKVDQQDIVSHELEGHGESDGTHELPS